MNYPNLGNSGNQFYLAVECHVSTFSIVHNVHFIVSRPTSNAIDSKSLKHKTPNF